MGKWLTRTVLVLSLVSLLNDMAGEMLYPVIPLYLASIGYGAVWIGIMDGMAEAISGLTRGWFGEWSDNAGRRLPFIKIGYSFSTIAKPALIFIASPVWVVFTRMLDRFGKGIRTGARDAMLSTEATSKDRGKIFGFHRAMDTAGAFLGPIVALIWFAFHTTINYRILFYFAFIPGVLSLLVLFLLKEKKTKRSKGMPGSPLRAFAYWKKATKEYRSLMLIIFLFTLFNSSDMFILLKVKELFPHGCTLFNGYQLSVGMTVIAFYIFFNFVYALFSYPAGHLSDKFGPKKMMIIGYFFFAIAYLGFGLIGKNGAGTNITGLTCIYIAYGLYAAFTDGVSKAWISRLCGTEEKGRALGLLSAFMSLGTLIASVSAGLIWKFIDPLYVFILPAIVALITIICLTFVMKDPKSDHP